LYKYQPVADGKKEKPCMIKLALLVVTIGCRARSPLVWIEQWFGGANRREWNKEPDRFEKLRPREFWLAG
jgi:hypothetical protein